MKELRVALEAAREAGKILNRHFRKNLRVYRKADRSPVTIADRASERKIVATIRKYFPGHNFLGEEFTYRRTGSPYTWIIDPLDGTRNFVRGVPFFGICIGLEKNGEIIAGVINMPAVGLLGYATKGGGAFVNGKRAKVSRTSRIEDSYVVFGDVDKYRTRGYGKPFQALTRRCEQNRGFGDTLGYLLLAQGFVDIALDDPYPWDVAAAKIIVEEAGGRITDYSGKDTIHSRHSIATNGKLHNAVLNLFRKRRSK